MTERDRKIIANEERRESLLEESRSAWRRLLVTCEVRDADGLASIDFDAVRGLVDKLEEAKREMRALQTARRELTQR